MFQGRSVDVRRLDSWKLIAGYVGRSCRTVQRWHTLYGLPIHRLGGNCGAIFAFTDELDAWIRSCGQSRGEIGQAGRIADRSGANEEKLIPFLLPGSGAPAPTPSLSPSMERVYQANTIWKNLTWANLTTVTCLFREAIDLDPENGEAYGGLAVATILRSILGGIRTPAGFRAATVAVEHGLACGPQSAALRTARALLDIFLHRDLGPAAKTIQELLEAQPSITQALGALSMIGIAKGNLKAAIRNLDLVSELNALSFSVIPIRAWCHYLAGHPRKALHEIRQSASSGRLGPFCDGVEALALISQGCRESQLAHLEELAAGTHDRDVLDGALGYFHAISGRTDRAREILDQLAPDGDLDRSHEPYAVALVHLGLGERRQAVVRLAQAWDEGSIWSLAFGFDPLLKSLDEEPDFEALLARVAAFRASAPARNPRVHLNVMEEEDQTLRMRAAE